MRHPTRSLIIGGFVILAALGFLVYEGISNNLVYYLTPSELLAKSNIEGQSFRLGGQVRMGSVHWNAGSQLLSFIIQDPKASLEVVSHGVPPALFRGGRGVVVEGTYAHHLFDATTLMIKHSNSYRAPAKGKTPNPSSFEGTK